MIGEDITQVLEPDTDEVVELTEEIREQDTFRPMTEVEKDFLFYSALRGYGYKG